MPQRSDTTQRVLEHVERRKAAGERGRQFFVREEHMQILRRFQIQHGYASQSTALQALLERLRVEQNTGGAPSASPLNDNPNTRDRA